MHYYVNKTAYFRLYLNLHVLALSAIQTSVKVDGIYRSPSLFNPALGDLTNLCTMSTLILEWKLIFCPRPCSPLLMAAAIMRPSWWSNSKKTLSYLLPPSLLMLAKIQVST